MNRLLPLAVLAVALPAAAQGAFSFETFNAGLGAVEGTNGVAVADYDGDVDLDVYVVVKAAHDPSDVRTWSRLYQNQGDGTFADATLGAELAVRTAATEAETRGFGVQYTAAWGDYDGDGWPDLFLGHMGPDQLFRNDGDGTFTEVTEAAGVGGLGGGYVTSASAWLDYDHDGDLDLYVGAWWDYAAARSLRNRLYENRGDGTFADVSAASGLDDPGATWTALPFDADADGLTDLYLATDVDTLTGVGVNKLYLNNGDRTFRDATAALGLGDDGYGMGVALGDADGNGLLDLYLTNVSTPDRAQRNPLFLQTAPGVYADGVAAAEAAGVGVAGWGWGTAFADLESDGDEDLVVVTGLFDADFPTYLFENDGAGRFTEAAAALGVVDPDAARGLAVFDADGDGDLDLLISHARRRLSLWANGLAQGRWLRVELEGTASNRDGLGARVEAWAGGRAHVRLHHGVQYLAQSLTPVHIGLGDATAVDSLVVAWPSGRTERFFDLAVDQQVTVVEGTGWAVTAEGPPESGLRLVALGPTPTASGGVRLWIESDAPAALSLTVTDRLGRRVGRSEAAVGAGRRAVAVTTEGLAPGLYLVRVERADGRSVVGRVVVAR